MDLTPQELREDTEEIIRKAYAAGWRESKRWPSHAEPPELEIIWDMPGGIRIRELPRRPHVAAVPRHEHVDAVLTGAPLSDPARCSACLWEGSSAGMTAETLCPACRKPALN